MLGKSFEGLRGVRSHLVFFGILEAVLAGDRRGSTGGSVVLISNPIGKGKIIGEFTGVTAS